VRANGTFGPVVLGLALVLGALGDVLLPVTPWGINALVCIAVLVVAVQVTAWWRRGVEAGGAALTLLALPFAAGIAWRDSPVLKGLDVAAVLLMLSAPALLAVAGSLRRASITQWAWASLSATAATLSESSSLLSRDIEWEAVRRGGWARHAVAAGRGIVIAAPIVTVFGGLLLAADAAFQGIVSRSVQVIPQDLARHICFTALGAWIVGGYLRGTIAGQPSAPPPVRRPATLRLGIVEVGVVLGLIDLLFLAFVIVQFRYFFGGAERVLNSTTLTYAEYARHGFFELVTVAALVLPLLLLAHWLLQAERGAHERIFHALAGLQLALLSVIMVSALQRMRLYQREYGLTELRLYTTAFMGWLAVVFVWFAVTVPRGRRDHFAIGALAAGLLTIGVLHALNPDALIARINTSRAASGRRFDAAYATRLSADAVPVLVEALPSLQGQDRCTVERALRDRWSRPEHADRRAWSLAREGAWRAVGERQVTLRATAC